MQTEENTVNLQTALDLGLTEDEYRRIEGIMGATPTFTELCIFSRMWSEPYARKNARFWLNKLGSGDEPYTGSNVDFPPSIPLGAGHYGLLHVAPVPAPVSPDGPSDPHPVAGWLFLTGAARSGQSVALLSALHVSASDPSVTKQKVRRISDDVSAAAADFDVPVYPSELHLDACYEEHALTTVVSLATGKAGKTTARRLPAPGDPVLLAGHATAKAGLRELTFALSAPATDQPDAAPRQSPEQPHWEKGLLEAALKAWETEAVLAMRPVHTAGIAGAAVGLIGHEGYGVRLDLSRLTSPLQPYELLLSNSAGRLLIVGQPGMEASLRAPFEEKGLRCQVIGEIANTRRLEVLHQDRTVASIPVYPLTPIGAPIYQLAYSRPAYIKEHRQFRASHIPKPESYPDAARSLWAAARIVAKSRRWRGSPAGATDAVLIPIALPDQQLALAIGGNPQYTLADPQSGAMIAIAGAARRVICSGGEPLAAGACLYFGTPYEKEVYWQFVQSIKGIGEVCAKLGLSLSGAEVSFCHQRVFPDRTEAICPTPVIAVLGTVETPMPLGFQQAGHQLYMLGTPSNDLASSEYLRFLHQFERSPAPRFELDEEVYLQQSLKRMIREKRIASAHDISEGGLFVALTEAAVISGLGFHIESDNNFRKDAYLFGEGQNRIVVSAAPENEDDLVNFLNSHNVSFTKLGAVLQDRIIIDDEDFGLVADWQRPFETTPG